jgi:hypothetical protein
MVSYAGAAMPGAQEITRIGLERQGLAERNELREYEEFLRMNPDYMNQAIAYATGSVNVNQKPIVQGGPGFWATSANLAGQLAMAAGMAKSSKKLKDVGEEVDTSSIASRMSTLPIHRWNYKGDKIKHIGPMAEDFRDTFDVGDGKTLHLVDIMGVLLAVNKEVAAKHVGSSQTEGVRASASN